MRANTLLFTTLFTITTAVAHAAPTLITGTPANSYLATPSAPSPNIGVDLNFDALAPNTTFNPNTYAAAGVTISSPDGLTVLPYSTQSAPNELFDNGANGTADITIKLNNGVKQIGVGIADIDGAPITLEALNAGGHPFGSSFAVNLDPNSGNGYFVLSDTSSDIFGLTILQPNGSPNNSGLAIDDVEFTPEPATYALFALGCVLAVSGLRRRA